MPTSTLLDASVATSPSRPRWRRAVLRWLRPDLDRVAYLAELRHLGELARIGVRTSGPSADHAGI